MSGPMAEIDVERIKEATFLVTVQDDGGTTTHEVTDEDDAAARLAQGADEAAFVAAAFRFLLEREPKESILRRFDVRVIPRYFPEFERRIGEYL